MKKKYHFYEEKKGYTLIEILAVLVIMGVIATIAIFGVLELIQWSKMESFRATAINISGASSLYASDKGMEEGDEKIVIKYPDDKNTLEIRGKLPDYGKVVIETENDITMNLYSRELRTCAYKDKISTKVRLVRSMTAYECYIYEGEEGENNGSGGNSDNTDLANGGNTSFLGWITLHLFYPEESYDRMWRLDTNGEVRTNEDDWQEYTGPITIPIDRVEDVWIKYKLDESGYKIIAPNGKAVVDIVPDETKKLVEKVKIRIDYDENATKKLYRIDYGTWQEYTKEFYVTENVIIEAKVEKNVDIFDNLGNKVGTKKLTGRDSYEIENIKPADPVPGIPAPIITRTTPDVGNVAAVIITYPESSKNKTYKIDYGIAMTYSEKVNFKTYDHVIQAYYYTLDGKKSMVAKKIIDEPDTEQVNQGPGGTGGGGICTKDCPLDEPIINANPESIATSVSVTVDYPIEAIDKYIKIGSGKYEKYTGAKILTSQAMVYAYYLDINGEMSPIAVRNINNFLTPPGPGGSGKVYPSVSIELEPLRDRTTSVNVKIYSSDATEVLYSFDGHNYLPYTGAFNVTKNTAIYAVARNANGEDTDQAYITNIGTNPPIKDKLSVDIVAKPDLTGTTTKTDEVLVTIVYDIRATTKKYSLDGTTFIDYTGPFKVTKNTTITGIATSQTGYGSRKKLITGIGTPEVAVPVITINPEETITSQVEVSIAYGTETTIKQYRIGSGELTNYTGPFIVKENTTIYAYASNGTDEKISSRNITNIKTEATVDKVTIIEMDKYFLLKLNYPKTAFIKEYKYTEAGTWKTYPTDGILLIKAEYKDEIVNNSKVIIKIKDENGLYKVFNGDYYFIQGSVYDIRDSIYMRWDMTKPTGPTYLIDDTSYTDRVNVSVINSSKCISSEYSIMEPGLERTEWTKYTNPITVTKNNTVIYGRCINAFEVYSQETNYKVINIDDTAPVISSVTNVTRSSSITITINANDPESELYKYEVRLNSGEWIDTNMSSTYKFNGLTEATAYVIDVRVKNILGLTSEVKTYNITTPIMELPLITVTDLAVWKPIKNVTFTIPSNQPLNEYTYLYSFDNVTWNNYIGPFGLIYNTSLYVKLIDSNGVVKTTNLIIDKIDNTVPTINLNSVPSLVTLGSSYTLPTTYTLNSSLSGGTVTCKSGTTNYTNTEVMQIGIYNLVCTVTTGAGNVATASKTIEVKNGIPIVADNLYELLNSNKMIDNQSYSVTFSNDQIIDIEYHEIGGDVTYSSNPTLCNNLMDTYMCVYKYTGNLTINSGVTLTPQVRKKGLLIYVNQTLTNNGTISMTARGASAVGQDVLLYKNSNSSYEYVPALGAVGGGGIGGLYAKAAGNPGHSASTVLTSIRATGGGGGGSVYNSLTDRGIGTPEVAVPVITINPEETITSQVEVSIAYGTETTIKQYRIGSGELTNYTGPFIVKENTTIYAYASNGTDEKISSRNITNIKTEATVDKVTIIEMDKYFLLKLNYPKTAFIKEYKYTEAGTWKTYPTDGILLIKAEYKDEIVNNSKVIIKIKDENGLYKVFNGDYYFIQGSVYDIRDSIYMRWDMTKPTGPTYLIDDTSYTDRVNVSVINSSKCISSEYSIMEPGLERTEWTKYTNPITVTKNNTVIYGRCINAFEVYSQETNYKVINIDDTAPVISSVTNVTRSSSITITINANDPESELYKYEVRLNSGEWIDTNMSSTYKFNGLTEATAYVIDVRVKNILGLTSEVKTYNITTPIMELPLITVTDLAVWKPIKNVTFTIPSNQPLNEYTYLYSFDNVTWNNYIGPFGLIYNTSLYVKLIDSNGVVKTTNLIIDKIDNTVPTINLNSVPSLVTLGSSYTLPTTYTLNSSLSGGTVTCKSGTTNYTNTEVMQIGIYNLVCTVTTGAGNVATASKTIEVKNGIPIVADNLYELLNSNKMIDNQSYSVTFSNDQIIDIEYHEIGGDVTYSSNPTLCNNLMDTYMCVYKYTGNLTINSGVTLTPQVRKKGLLIYVNQTLTNNGTISMTARGASAVGQDVLLYKNSNSSYEYVPALGAVGGGGIGGLYAKAAGNPGHSASTVLTSIRATGGGGGGSVYNSLTDRGTSGSGGAGSSYSGGTGGGSSDSRKYNAGNGAPNGGAGGFAEAAAGSGGAGNPGGSAGDSWKTCVAGANGTGGLLMIYSNSLINNGTLQSNGIQNVVTNKYRPDTSGGSSGGGSINIFYKNSFSNTGTISSAGGLATTGAAYNGGAGGTGSVTIGSIETGTFIIN
ncbi:MAG: type II secretion system protein [Bacilli bacterium]|nr:type II secretion system protein [Bacilli bacterium]